MVTLLFGPMLVLGLLISSTVSTVSRLRADVPPPDHFMKGLRFDNFDLRLCQALYESSPTKNVAVSPVSVKLVLAMLYEAARGDTAAEIQKSLDLPYLKRETRHKFGAIQKSLNTPSNNTDLRIASNIFVSPKVFPSSNYQRILDKHYSAQIDVVDFKKPENAAKVVNDWVREATNGKITSMLDPDDPDIPNLSTIISNALYFKGKWEVPFDPNNTKAGTFYLRNNRTINVQMMKNNNSFFVADNMEGAYTLLRLPYLDNKYSMYIIIPHELNGLDDVLSKLTPDGIRDTIKEMEKLPFTLLLPKFTFEFAVDLEPILKKLEINKIFSPDEAEFPLISNTTKVYISRILHKAGLEVNEYGSTVYAATQANMGTRFGGSDEVLKVDHPFIFFIKDDTAETIIFAAKVENPLTKPQATTTTTVPPSSTKPSHKLVHSRLGEKNDRNGQTSPPNCPDSILTRINRPNKYYRIIQTRSRNQRQVRGYGNPNRGYGTDFNPFGFNNFNIPQPNFNVFPNYPFGPQGFNQNFGQFPGYNPGYPTQVNNRRTSGWRPQVVPPRPPQISSTRPPAPIALSGATTPRTPAPIGNTTPNTTPILTIMPTPGAPRNNLPAPDEEVIRQIFGTPTPPPSNSNTDRPTTNRQNLVNDLFYNINSGANPRQ